MIAEKYMLGPELGGARCRQGEKLYLATRGLQGGDQGSERFAIQLVRKDLLSDEAKTCLQRDTAALKQLDHPNIARLIEVCEDASNYYWVMEYCSGGELARNLVKRERYSEEEARRLIKSIAEAVAYCHSKHIVVRDLSLANVFFDSDSEGAQVKLVNVGLTRSMESSYIESAYVAPEFLKKESYTMAEDMWALGVLAFVLLCGYHPFKGETEHDILRQVKGATFSFDQQDWQDTSDESKDLIRHLLRLDSSKRLSASAVLSHPWMTAELKNLTLKHSLRSLAATLAKQNCSPRSSKGKEKGASSSSLDTTSNGKARSKSKVKKPKPVHPLDLDLFRVALLPLVGSMLVALGLYHLSPAPRQEIVPMDVAFGSAVLCYLVILHSSRCVTLGLHYLGEILWGCNIALLLAGVGIATNRPLMVGTAVCIVAVDQICWYIDVLGYFVTGKFIVGVAKYMKAPTTTWVHFWTGTHHLWFIPISIAWLGQHGGVPSGSYWGSVLVTTVIASMARVMTPYSVLHGVDNQSVHVWNINLCYEFYEDVAIPPLHILDHRPPYVFLPFLVVVCNFVLNVVPVAVVIALSRVPFGGPVSLASDWALFDIPRSISG